MDFKDIAKITHRGMLQFTQTILSLVLICAFSRRCTWFKQCKAKKNALVLGNGPSLACDLAKVVGISKNKNTDIWSVNNFAFTDEFCQIQPVFYVLADPNYWREKVSADSLMTRDRLVKTLNSKVTWPMQLLLPLKAKGCQAVELFTSTNVTVSFYNSTAVDGISVFRHWAYTCGLGMPAPLNVLVAALSLAAMKKYSKIFIAGADHSWHEELVVAERGSVLVTQKHFYPEKSSAKPVFKTGEDQFSIGELFLRWGEVFKLYEVLKQYGDSQNIKFINSSNKTYIDAFERGGLHQLLENNRG